MVIELDLTVRAARRCAARGCPRARHGAGSTHAAADIHGAGGAAVACCVLRRSTSSVTRCC
jgi:hypothetical protein